MSILDIVIIVILIIGGLIGYKRGAISSLLHLVGSLIVFILAFYLKGPVSIILAELLPLNLDTGIFEGITSISFLIYDGIAFIILSIIFTILLNLLLKVTGIINKLINKTVILALPNHIIGAVLGVLRYFILGFFILFISSIIPFTSKTIKESKVSLAILNNTPILSGITKDFNKSIKDIYSLIDKYKDETEDVHDVIDYDVLDILLKNKIISIDTVKEMSKSGKLEIKDIDKLIEKYEE